MCGLAAPFHQPTRSAGWKRLISRSSFPVIAHTANHLLRHECKTDTHSHARLNSFGGIWKPECRDPNIPLCFQEHRLKRKCTLWKVLSISKLRYWYMPWINRPGSQPPLKSDDRGMCWMVIFYWRGMGWWSRGVGIRKGTSFLVGTKGDQTALLAKLQCHLTFGTPFLCVRGHTQEQAVSDVFH